MTATTPKLSALLVALALVAAACGGTADGADDADAAAAAGADEDGAAEQAEGGGDADPAADADSSDEQGTAPSGEPIRVGGSLALTGPLAATAAIHKVAGDLFVERINASGGLLGRPVEWVLLDDESVPERSAAAYERLITEEEVDLVIGPYATGTITAAMQVAQRYGYTFPHHSGGLTYAYTYDCHFPLFAIGRRPNLTTPAMVFDALEASGQPPETVAFVTNQFPVNLFVANGQEGSGEGGATEVAQERGYEVVLDIEFPSNTADFGPIAAQVRDAAPDFLFVGAVGLDGTNIINAMEAIGYRPPGQFYMYPAPGPLLALGDPAEDSLAVTVFEPNSALADTPEADRLVEDFSGAAEEAGLPYPVLETQAATSWSAWEVLTGAVEATGSLDNAEICEYLQETQVETTLTGAIEFGTEESNYYGDRQVLKQVQDGDWVVVWPPEAAAQGAELRYPSEG